jgi:hypothetical protein
MTDEAMKIPQWRGLYLISQTGICQYLSGLWNIVQKTMGAPLRLISIFPEGANCPAQSGCLVNQDNPQPRAALVQKKGCAQAGQTGPDNDNIVFLLQPSPPHLIIEIQKISYGPTTGKL